MRVLPSDVLGCVGLMLLPGCGRIGFEMHAPREQTEPAGAIARSPDVPDAASAPPMDAGRPPATVTATVPRDAAVPARGAGKADNGSACSSDSECASAACVAGVCCSQACSQPPQCRSLAAVSCSDGSTCNYPSAASGACDDGDPCTSGDYCMAGSCRPGLGLGCEDDQTCTADFCSRGACEHASSCNPEQADCSYALHAGHGYWLCPAPVAYDTADAACQRLGGHLVTIDDQSEQDFLWSNGMRDTWIGLRTRSPAADGGWAWASGPSTFVDWAEAEPDAGEGASCAYLSAADGGEWSARDCTAAAGFACELEQHVPPDASCVYARRDDRGYFICDSARTVWDAERLCVISGTTLTEIGDATEQAFLAARLTAGASYAIGMTDVASEGQFVWFSGAPTSYFAWADGEPAADADDQDYVVMSADRGRWRTVTTNERQFFICEEPHQR